MKTIYHSSTKYFLVVCVIIALSFSSCESFLDVDLPKSQLTNDAVFDSYETATIAMTDVYSKMRDKGLLTGTSFGISNQLAIYSDELVSYANQSSANYNFFNNSLLPTNTTVTDYWNLTYNQIYSSNLVIEGVRNSKTLTSEQKNQLEGEALFVRALLHFYLVNLFGDIPYITQSNYTTNSNVSRISTEGVYAMIIEDLKRSIELLPLNYISSNKIRPNQSTAKALLSRVYLYGKSWIEAENIASSLINETTLFSFEDNINNVFLIGSKETLWQLQSANAGQNTADGATFIFISGPPLAVSLSPNLVNSFTSNDLRKSNWIKAITNGTTTWYHPNKYKERSTTTASKEYSIVFRLTEQYLIRAEARAQQEKLAGAKEDLNKIRLRAGLGGTPALTKADLLAAILQERRWELFTERGHRFFDLKRNDQLDQVLSIVKPGWNSADRLFPIPQKELSTNPNLRPQNPGY
ncbi:RagB/SusD family nutrient uptake outer membrane protein [Pedobacter sp. Hv1]|uniref:RagB/SusD family nutrient uptake outer membrane protein n=1 Tax=Pedobacter sp. Hv1 TaxID=1740090 RepID=UPI0006D8AE94|nr:RagB/SusD family nutrient uptake outer membrane protein [Pedobacter sp. Hv1]KQC02047.1 starch-binding protein [Pedobacter sp. Hv1]